MFSYSQVVLSACLTPNTGFHSKSSQFFIWENEDFFPRNFFSVLNFVVGMQTSTATMENSVEIS